MEIFFVCSLLWLLCLLHKYDTRLLLGNVCESVPLDRTGSYVYISMENAMYINNYNTCSFVVQVVSSWNTGLVLEFGITWCSSVFTVMQGLLWVTCTGRHWLIALQIMTGATY